MRPIGFSLLANPRIRNDITGKPKTVIKSRQKNHFMEQIKQFIRTKWWIILLVLCAIGFFSKNESSSSKGKNRSSGRMVSCDQCRQDFEYGTGFNFRKPKDYSPDYSDYNFCSRECGMNFASEHGINVAN